MHIHTIPNGSLLPDGFLGHHKPPGLQVGASSVPARPAGLAPVGPRLRPYLQLQGVDPGVASAQDVEQQNRTEKPPPVGHPCSQGMLLL